MTSRVAETARSQRQGPRHPTLSQLWVFVAVSLPVVALLLPKLSAIDLAYLVRAGNIMLDSHRLLSSDPFSFPAAGKPWLNQQWGAEIVFALLFRLGGWPLLVLVRALLSGTIYWLIYRACRLRGAGPKLAAVLSIASFGVSLPGLILRPQILGLTLFALTLAVLAGRHGRPKATWAVVGIVALWANIHGSFFLGPLLASFAYLEDRLASRPTARVTGFVAVASVAAASLNPYGVRVWAYALDITTNRVITSTIVEWRPPTIRTEPGLGFFLSAGAVIILLAMRGRPTPWLSLAQLGVFFVIGLFAARGIYWWALAAPPIVAPLVGHRFAPSSDSGDRSALNTAMAVLLVVLGIAFLPWWRTGGRLGSEALLDHAPPGVTAALGSILRPGQRIFDPQIWGSWLEFKFPQNPVFVDSRIEMFSDRVWTEYDEVSGAIQGWDQILDRWHVDVLVASRLQQNALIPYIGRSGRWQVVYRDAQGVVAVRR